MAGFDLTFSVPKSVSAVWAVADADTQAAIYRAHRDAIDTALGWAEQQRRCSPAPAPAARCRSRSAGVVAAAFDHWDSRAGDPHLHTHVVVANRVQTADGRWRTWTARTLFRYTVALSELHEGVLQDLLTERLGYGWDERARAPLGGAAVGHRRRPDALIEEFSQRSSADRATPRTTSSSSFARAARAAPHRRRDAAAAATGHPRDPAGQAAAHPGRADADMARPRPAVIVGDDTAAFGPHAARPQPAARR